MGDLGESAPIPALPKERERIEPAAVSAGAVAKADREFDADALRLAAVDSYQKVRPLYIDFSQRLRGILEEALTNRGVKVASIDNRAKTLESFGRKASLANEDDPSRPKYLHPLKDITDMAGVRVITFFPKTVEAVDVAINAELEVTERSDKGDLLRQQEKFGYQSIHYLVKLRSNRTALSEYARFVDLVAEVQVRTVLQHAWAEIEHDIQYHSSEAIPASIRRRFMSLAGMLEIADREFQAIQDEDERLRAAARKSVELGRLAEVEITPDALKAYLDRKLGSDDRISEFTYELIARVLRKLGFVNLQQVEDCIGGFSDDKVSRAIWGSRQGQVTRFEGLLLAGMGESYIRNHLWSDGQWFVDLENRHLQRLRDSGIKVGDYSPTGRPPDHSHMRQAG